MIMILIIVSIVIILLIVAMTFYKLSFDWQSFIMPTLPLKRGQFGVYCFTGKQGSGKTYSLVKYISKHLGKHQKLYSNIKLDGIKYTPITSVDDILKLGFERNCFIVYDEIFTIMEKSTKIRQPMIEFLSQQRKMENVFMTTAQEWLEIPISFRRFIRIQINCITRPLGHLGGLLFEEYNDGYAMKWSQEENEYIAPRISMKVSKYEKRYMVRYDTLQRVSTSTPAQGAPAQNVMRASQRA